MSSKTFLIPIISIVILIVIVGDIVCAKKEGASKRGEVLKTNKREEKQLRLLLKRDNDHRLVDNDCLQTTSEKDAYCECAKSELDVYSEETYEKCCKKHMNDDCRREAKVTGKGTGEECTQVMGKIYDCELDDRNGQSAMQQNMMMPVIISVLTTILLT